MEEAGTESELILTDRAQKGDNTARRKLYTRYSGYVMALAMRYVADRDAARDVVQDCFVRVFTSLGDFRFRGEGSLKAWVMRIAVNISIDHLRRNARFDTTDRIPDIGNDDDEYPDTERIPTAVIMQMIERLPAGYRTVFNLYVLEERSHKEIARMLGIKEDSSASQLLRAKRMLARMIKEYEKEQQRR